MGWGFPPPQRELRAGDVVTVNANSLVVLVEEVGKRSNRGVQKALCSWTALGIRQEYWFDTAGLTLVENPPLDRPAR